MRIEVAKYFAETVVFVWNVLFTRIIVIYN